MAYGVCLGWIPLAALKGLNDNGTPICFWYPLNFNSSNLKMDGRKTIFFLLGWPIFKGYVSFREGMGLSYLLRLVQVFGCYVFGLQKHTEPQFRWPGMSRVSFGRARFKTNYIYQKIYQHLQRGAKFFFHHPLES